MANLFPSWHDWQRWLKDETLPLAAIYLPALDENIRRIREKALASGKPLRVASKSVRCTAMLRRILERGEGIFRGLMCFAVPEADKLADAGFTDLLVAYPTIQRADIELAVKLAKRNVGFKLVVDNEEHLRALAQMAGQNRVVVDVVLELDVSYRPASGRLHLGVRRSPLRTAEEIGRLAQVAAGLKGVRVVGLMGYEAQIAGLPDKIPAEPAKNSVKSLIKMFSRSDVRRRRAKAVAALRAAGAEVEVVNGGGTGSLDSTGDDKAVTELTAGSGFYCSHLFSHFRSIQLIPAAFFACRIVRASDPEFITCAGGGYIASGPTNADKQPIVWLPKGLKPVAMEGAGEVQTPLDRTACDQTLCLGDPVLFRHAKAGELCERFNELVLVGPEGIVDRVPTYRGEGWVFF